MLKNFYKRKRKLKTFFTPKMQLRSLAYGEEVQREAISWLEYYYSRRHSDGFVLSKQENVGGYTPAEKEKLPLGAGMPKLALNGVDYELRADGWVLTGGKQSALNVGKEIKAWAIASIPTSTGIVNAILVIGKPVGETATKLALYEMNKLGPTGKCVCRVEYPTTLDAVSHIIAIGRHIFTVHDRDTLSYYYYNIEENVLEEVGIGVDEPSRNQPWCQYVDKTVVADRSGGVFWLSEGELYGLKIGYPRNLIRIEKGVREEALAVKAEGAGIVYYTKDRNTGAMLETRYADNGNGYRLVSENTFGGRRI